MFDGKDLPISVPPHLRKTLAEQNKLCTCYTQKQTPEKFFDGQKIIQMVDLVKFCDKYNATGYGTAHIVELKNSFIIKLYNAGWSDNESMDNEFYGKYRNNIIYNRHPIMIAEFSKLHYTYSHFVVGYEDKKITQEMGEYYSKRKKFIYKIEIDTPEKEGDKQ